jgi:hypothetical protein
MPTPVLTAGTTSLIWLVVWLMAEGLLQPFGCMAFWAVLQPAQKTAIPYKTGGTQQSWGYNPGQSWGYNPGQSPGLVVNTFGVGLGGYLWAKPINTPPDWVAPMAVFWAG